MTKEKAVSLLFKLYTARKLLPTRAERLTIGQIAKAVGVTAPPVYSWFLWVRERRDDTPASKRKGKLPQSEAVVASIERLIEHFKITKARKK